MKNLFLSSAAIQLAVIWALFFFITISCGYASSVRHVTMDEMLQHCQFVFEGEVLVIEAIETSPKRIHTHVTFEIKDIIKGEYSSNIITLRFLGGTVGNRTMAISDMKFPQPGERGIYFVESLERMQVHPLYGWSQGHFLVRPDETGTGRVMTSSEEVVTAIIQNISSKQIKSIDETVSSLSTGIARGVVLEIEDKDQKGLTSDEFKKNLREIMERNSE
jgi:hypothetical protein